jgi:hypothetical protein
MREIMAETNINLGCAKINIKRDTHYYAPMDVINPQILNPIPEGAKTYKLTPSATLFFKHRCCSNLNFGLQQIKTKQIIKPTKGKIMSYNYMSKDNSQNMSKCVSENIPVRKKRKNMSFWQKASINFVRAFEEAPHDIVNLPANILIMSDEPSESFIYPRLSDKLTAFFQQKNSQQKNSKKNARTQVVLPTAPALPEPERNPEYQAGTTINNYHITICSIL